MPKKKHVYEINKKKKTSIPREFFDLKVNLHHLKLVFPDHVGGLCQQNKKKKNDNRKANPKHPKIYRYYASVKFCAFDSKEAW